MARLLLLLLSLCRWYWWSAEHDEAVSGSRRSWRDGRGHGKTIIASIKGTYSITMPLSLHTISAIHVHNKTFFLRMCSLQWNQDTSIKLGPAIKVAYVLQHHSTESLYTACRPESETTCLLQLRQAAKLSLLRLKNDI